MIVPGMFPEKLKLRGWQVLCGPCCRLSAPADRAGEPG